MVQKGWPRAENSSRDESWCFFRKLGEFFSALNNRILPEQAGVEIESVCEMLFRRETFIDSSLSLLAHCARALLITKQIDKAHRHRLAVAGRNDESSLA